MKNIYAVLVCAFIFSACQKEITVPNVDFEVTTNKSTYKAGETVKFLFSGNPDNIIFFSGEPGMKYEYRNRLKAEGEPRFEFTSFRQYGLQENTLRLFASTNFNGVMDENIGKADWKDITDRATLSTGSDNTPSGIISLKEFDDDKPLYLAFRFTGQASPTSAQRTWTIKNFTVQNVIADGIILNIADMSNISWSAMNVKNPDKVWTISIDQIRFAGGPSNTPDNEDWIVTKPLNLSKVSPDRGVALKNITTQMRSYEHVFSEPGKYVVTFVATNASAYEQKSTVKELNVTVDP